jgi:hypothetical protein
MTALLVKGFSLIELEPYSSETTFFAGGMDGALMLSSVTPSFTSFG